MKRKLVITLLLSMVIFNTVACGKVTEQPSNSLQPSESISSEEVVEVQAKNTDTSLDWKEITPDKELLDSMGYSFNSNTIDNTFAKIFSRSGMSEAEIRDYQKMYYQIWKNQYENFLDKVNEQCAFDNDKENVSLLVNQMDDYIATLDQIVLNEFAQGYNEENKLELWGNGTMYRLYMSRAMQYRNFCETLMASNPKVYELPTAEIMENEIDAAIYLASPNDNKTIEKIGYIPLQQNIQIRTNLNGDEWDDIITVQGYTVNQGSATELVATLYDENGSKKVKNYIEGIYGRTLTSGDLSGNGMSDILVCADDGCFGIYHMENDEWIEYPNTFIANPDINIEQPKGFANKEAFGDLDSYYTGTMFKESGKTMVRFIAKVDDDSAKIVDASYTEDGWYIENVEILNYFWSRNLCEEFEGVSILSF